MTTMATRVPAPSIRTLLLALAIAGGAPCSRAAAAEAVELRVMSFNVWYGGEQVSLAKIAEAIRAADPDVVGVQEADRNLERIAELADMPYVDPRRRLLSRWPLFDSGGGVRTESGPSPYSTTALDRDALHAWVMVRPGQVVAMSNVHLSNNPSGMSLVREGRPAAEVIALERDSRGVEVEPLAALGRLGASGVPVFLVGDFNTASHLDWTEARRRARGDIPYALDWPVTRRLADAGLRDSYREAHPDPAARPGYTWTPGAPYPLADHERSHSRIDYVFSAGPSRTLGAQIIGEPGGPDVDIAVSPWPSDHRALVARFAVEPAPAPAMIAVTPRRVLPGEAVLVRTWDPAGPGWTAVLVPRGGGAGDALTGVRDMPHDYQRSIPLATTGFAPGDYDALLLAEDGSELQRAAFTVAVPGARPTIEAVSQVLRRGAPIRARWQHAPGALRDWIGLYRAGETDLTQYLGFVYTEAAFAGEAVVVPTANGDLPPGDYELRLMHDESYVVLASARLQLLP
jgi:endonuclease/exonuclease/phosphatase family metal-dependent hydrolase